MTWTPGLLPPGDVASPPTLLGYAHLGERFYIDHDRNVIENPG